MRFVWIRSAMRCGPKCGPADQRPGHRRCADEGALLAPPWRSVAKSAATSTVPENSPLSASGAASRHVRQRAESQTEPRRRERSSPRADISAARGPGSSPTAARSVPGWSIVTDRGQDRTPRRWRGQRIQSIKAAKGQLLHEPARTARTKTSLDLLAPLPTKPLSKPANHAPLGLVAPLDADQ